MTRDPRNPSRWLNTEIERDPDGYVEARAAYREDREQAETRRREEEDLRRFTEAYFAAGGSRNEAASAFREQRDRQATEAASRAEASILQDSRRRIRKVL